MNTIYKSGVAALALTLGLGLGAINASAQTSTSGADAASEGTGGAAQSGSESNAGTSTGSGTSSDSSMNSTMAVDKASFAAQAESSNMFEIESSKLAEKQAKSSDVKKFAAMMIKDHTAAGKKMMKVMEKDGMQPKKAMMSKHEAMLKELQAAEGADFDKAYVMAQTQAHMEAVTLFSNYAAKPDDEALGAFAKETLPTLQEHLDHVQMLNGK